MLAEERRKLRAACERDNKQMFAARTEITDLKARVEELKKYEADYKDKYEEAKSHRERVEQIISKDKDLAGKDVELLRRLREVQESLKAERQKSDSIEIDLIAEKVKAETADEAHKASQATLNELRKTMLRLNRQWSLLSLTWGGCNIMVLRMLLIPS
ncbi:hypothetical protein Hdeb2414_s0010g00351671 [Helianthus debilis subsp. tardiflorus]